MMPIDPCLIGSISLLVHAASLRNRYSVTFVVQLLLLSTGSTATMTTSHNASLSHSNQPQHIRIAPYVATRQRIRAAQLHRSCKASMPSCVFASAVICIFSTENDKLRYDVSHAKE